MLKVMYEREARPAGRAAMAVYLIRHGETDWNRQMRLQGRRDIEMNETGIAQVRRSARALAALGVRPDVIVASPLSRARRSAELIARELGYAGEKILVEAGFIERDFGQGEGAPYTQEMIRRGSISYPGMESLEQVRERAGAALERTLGRFPDRELIIVSHGAVIPGLLSQLTGGGLPASSGALRVTPASVHKVEGPGPGARVWKLTDCAAWESVIY